MGTLLFQHHSNGGTGERASFIFETDTGRRKTLLLVGGERQELDRPSQTRSVSIRHNHVAKREEERLRPRLTRQHKRAGRCIIFREGEIVEALRAGARGASWSSPVVFGPTSQQGKRRRGKV